MFSFLSIIFELPGKTLTKEKVADIINAGCIPQIFFERKVLKWQKL
jgi:hypothetical protein